MYCRTEKRGRNCQRLVEFLPGEAAHRPENNVLLYREQAIGPNKAVQVQASALKVLRGQRDRISVETRLSGDLAENQIVSLEIDQNKRGAPFAGCKIG